MAEQKKNTDSKNNKPKRRRKSYAEITESKIVKLLAFIALFLAAAIFIVQFILGFFDVNLKIIGAFSLIRDLFIGIVLLLTAYNFVKPKSKVWKVTYWVVAAIYFIFAILVLIF